MLNDDKLKCEVSHMGELSYHGGHEHGQSKCEGNQNFIVTTLSACRTTKKVEDKNAEEFSENRFVEIISMSFELVSSQRIFERHT